MTGRRADFGVGAKERSAPPCPFTLTPSLLALFLLGWAATALGETPSAPQTAPELVAGKQLFAKWCAPCHANEPRLAGTLALQTRYQGKLPAALELRSDLTPDLVSFFVRSGVAWMPPFRKSEIGNAELAQIGAYLSAPLEQRGPPAELLAEEMMRERTVGPHAEGSD